MVVSSTGYISFTFSEEDTMFNGQTAFPESNTVVSGIRTRKKYKGHKVTDIWPGIKDL